MEAELDDIACQKSESSPDPLEKLKRVCDACFREIGENIHKYNSEHKEIFKDLYEYIEIAHQ